MGGGRVGKNGWFNYLYRRKPVACTHLQRKKLYKYILDITLYMYAGFFNQKGQALIKKKTVTTTTIGFYNNNKPIFNTSYL